MTTKKYRPITFLAVGLLNTLLDFLFYTFLVFVFFPQSKDIWIVGLISGIVALACAYTTHQLITWRDHPASKMTLVKFFVSTGLGLWIIRPLLLLWFIHFTSLYTFVFSLLAPLGFSYDFIASTGAFGFMVVIVTIYNFIMYDRFVFTKRHHTGQGTDSTS